LLSLLGIIGMTVWLGERSQTFFASAIEARDTRAAAVELRNALLAAESSQRGFLVTGNEIYLAPYGVAKTQALRQLDFFKRILAKDPQMEGMLHRLSDIVAEKFKETDDTIDLKNNRMEEKALAIIRTNRGKALMDEANVFLSGIIRAADERLTADVGQQRG